MSQQSTIKIKPTCILTVPLQTYMNDFSFIVNGKEFKTSRLISDLLSPIICQIHTNDPTFDTFTINTSHSGDFSHIIDLFNFNQNIILESEVPFIIEVIEILGTESFEYSLNESTEITIDNVFNLIKQHEKHSKFYSNRFSTEIDFISSHFFELCESREEEFRNISVGTLMQIASSDKLELNTEDQLLKFVNKFYDRDVKYSILYETVLFENVSSDAMKEFVSIFDKEDMSCLTWQRLSKRLSKEIEDESQANENRYREKPQLTFEISEFNGILNYFQTRTNSQIENEVVITSSSVESDSDQYRPQNVVIFEDPSKQLRTKNLSNSWLCFDFKEHRVIPTGYTIRSYPYGENSYHPKSWVIECSNDNNSWEVVSEEIDCSYLKGESLVHTFKMNQQKSKEFRYIRMRLTGPAWNNNNSLKISSFEIYGKLIQNIH